MDMPKYGKFLYGSGFYGDKTDVPGFPKVSIRGIPLGLEVRKRFGHLVIFRVRKGNGKANSIAGVQYQDKYKYVVPGNVNNEEGQSARDAFATAVLNWQTVLSEAEKKAYNKTATKRGGLSGYNLYIGEYVRKNA